MTNRKRYYVEGGEDGDFPTHEPVEPDVADRLMALKGENFRKNKGREENVDDLLSDPTVAKYVKLALRLPDKSASEAGAAQTQQAAASAAAPAHGYPGSYPMPPPPQTQMPPPVPQPRSTHERW